MIWLGLGVIATGVVMIAGAVAVMLFNRRTRRRIDEDLQRAEALVARAGLLHDMATAKLDVALQLHEAVKKVAQADMAVAQEIVRLSEEGVARAEPASDKRH